MRHHNRQNIEEEDDVPSGVTEFELESECCRNPTIFPPPNPTVLYRDNFWSNSTLVLR